jgi:hypothetical protein
VYSFRFLSAAVLSAAFSLVSSPVPAQLLEIEPNDTCGIAQDAGSLDSLPVDLAGELVPNFGAEPSGDVDFYQFSAPAGTELRARLFAQSDDFGPTWDAYLGLFDGDCNPITANDDYWNLNPRIDFTVPAGDTFILAATGCCDGTFEGYHGAAGLYSLRLLVPPTPIAGITGRIVDGVTGEPLAGGAYPSPWVELRRCSTAGCTTWVSSQSADEGGVFRFETDQYGNPLDPGTWVVQVWANEYVGLEAGPFEVASGETFDLGDLALEPPPFQFTNVRPCTDISAEGGACWYAVDIRNNTSLAVQGMGWSLVTAYGGTSPLGYSIFQAEKTRQLRVAGRSAATLRFRFDVPRGVVEGTTMCATAWFSDRANEYFGTLRNDTLFCVMKQYGALQIVSPKEAAARLGIDGSGSWKHGRGEPRR